MTLEALRSVAAARGFDVEPLSDATFRARFQGRRRAFPVFVHLEKGFAVFALVPYARVPADRSAAERLFAALLRKNREMNLAKFSIDDDGDVVLSVELRRSMLREDVVADALDALAVFADRYDDEVGRLAEPPA